MEEVAFYRPILKKAWQITWKFKNLWVLGIFAAILSSGGEFEILSQLLSSPQKTGGMFKNFIAYFQQGLQSVGATQNIWLSAWSAISTTPLAFLSTLLILLIAIIIAVFFIWLTITSQVGLIRNINLAGKGKSSTINEGIDYGVKNFWPILGVNALLKIALLAVFLIANAALWLLNKNETIGLLLYVIIEIILFIAVFIVSFILRYQIFHIALKGEKFKKAIKSSWKLFIKNWLVSIEMALLVFIAYLVAVLLIVVIDAILTAVPFVVLFLPPIAPAAVAIITAVSLLALLAVTILITAIFTVFQWSAWALLFGQITGGKISSKIVRLSEQSPNITNLFARK